MDTCKHEAWIRARLQERSDSAHQADQPSQQAAKVESIQVVSATSLRVCAPDRVE